MLNKKISACILTVMIFSQTICFGEEQWTLEEFKEKTKDSFANNNWEEIRSYATIDMNGNIAKTDEIYVEIDESNIINQVRQELLGMQHEFSDEAKYYMENGDISQNVKDFAKSTWKIPVLRWGGTSSTYVNYANIMDQYDKRTGSKMQYLPIQSSENIAYSLSSKGANTYEMGPGEYLKMMYSNNPDMKVIPCVSVVTMSPEDIVSFTRFMTDRADESQWGKMRAEIYGIEKPCDVYYWEITNEIDQYTPDTQAWYVDRARETIDAIKSVEPEAKIAVCGPSAPWGNNMWKIDSWVPYVAKNLGDRMDAITWHPYYDGYSAELMLYLSDRIKMLMDKEVSENNIQDDAGNLKDIKILGTEGARYWEPSDWFPGSGNFDAALSTANFLNLMFSRDYYVGNMLHSLRSNYRMWPFWVFDDEGGIFESPTVKAYELYDCVLGDRVVKSDWAYIENGEIGEFKNSKLIDFQTESPNTRNYFSVNVMAKGEDELIVVMVNKEPYHDLDISFNFKNSYTLVEEKVLSAPNIFTFTWDKKSEELTRITSTEKNEPDFKSYHMGNGTMTALRLKTKAKLSSLGGSESQIDDETLSEDNSFSDMKYHWAKKEASKMKEMGFITGVNGLFMPDDAITMGEVGAIVSKMLSLDLTYRGQLFSDVFEDDWFLPYANALYANGYVRDSKFGGNKTVTRDRLCAVVNKIYEQKVDLEKTTEHEEILKSLDGFNLSPKEAEALSYGMERGFIYDFRSYSSTAVDAPLTRAEATAILYRLYQKIQ